MQQMSLWHVGRQLRRSLLGLGTALALASVSGCGPASASAEPPVSAVQARVAASVVATMSTAATRPATPTATKGTRPAVVTPQCSRIVVFGLRGSRSDTQDTGVADALINRFYNQFRYAWTGQRAPSTKLVRLQMVNYPAVPVPTAANGYGMNYLSSVATGSTLLAAAARQLKQACPNSRYVMVGYSQGANVVGRFGRDAWREGLLTQGIAYVLFGNPARNNSISSIELIKVAHGGHGILYSGLKLLSWPSPMDELTTPRGADLKRTLDVCLPDDPICSFRGSASADALANCAVFTCDHFDYQRNGWTDVAAGWAAGKAAVALR
jgi:hypothetical protein